MQYSLFNLTAILGIILITALLLPIVIAKIFAEPYTGTEIDTWIATLQIGQSMVS